MREMESCSVDAVVTDPPYGLKFMGKKWDYDVPSIELWREVLRILKPGGHLLSFGGTRTYHRMVVNIEEAGFEIRDQIMWLYGSGFPKSHDVSKSLDKFHNARREVVGIHHRHGGGKHTNVPDSHPNSHNMCRLKPDNKLPLTAPATPDAIKWQGWGTALKPANEPIVLARKPLDASCSIAQNVLKWGVGGLNIDDTRIGYQSAADFEKAKGGDVGSSNRSMDGWGLGKAIPQSQKINAQGRWPANVILSCDCEGTVHGQLCAVHLLDEQSGQLQSRPNSQPKKLDKSPKWYENKDPNKLRTQHDVSGGASRFFYVAKASKRERNHGCEGMAVKDGEPNQELGPNASHRQANAQERAMGMTHVERKQNQNHHPTVKPIKLMEYLIKLITPHGGLVLDPFMGSGSTGVAARKLGFEFIGIEMEQAYCEIASRRISAVSNGQEDLGEPSHLSLSPHANDTGDKAL